MAEIARQNNFCLAIDTGALRSPVVLNAQLFKRLFENPATLWNVSPFEQQYDVGYAASKLACGYRIALSG